MRILYQVVQATCALLVTLMIAGHTSTALTVLPRTQHCSNAPTVVAGSFYNPHLLNARGNPIRTYWCAPSGRTYIVLGKVIPVAGSEIVRLLVNFNAHLQRTLSAADDGPLRGGDYVWGLEQDYNIRVGNANNHQCTYGVMRAAVAALYDYMLAENDFGTVKFDIWDGENQVGQGIVESTAAFPGLL